MYYAVGELLILINFFMNALVIWLTARVTNYPLTKARLLVGAFIASLYFFLPSLDGIFSIIFNLIFSCVLIMIVFSPGRIKEFISLLLVFYGVSFFLGGGLLGIVFIFNPFQEMVYGELSWGYLSLSLVLGGIILWGIKSINDKLKSKSLALKVEIRLNDKSCILEGMVDTGNMLKSSTGVPCIIVEKKEVQTLFTPDLYKMIKENSDVMGLLNEMDPLDIETCNFQPLFYKTVSHCQQVILAFRPHELLVHDIKNNVTYPVASLVALSDNELNLPEGISCLLPPELL